MTSNVTMRPHDQGELLKGIVEPHSECGWVLPELEPPLGGQHPHGLEPAAESVASAAVGVPVRLPPLLTAGVWIGGGDVRGVACISDAGCTEVGCIGGGSGGSGGGAVTGRERMIGLANAPGLLGRVGGGGCARA